MGALLAITSRREDHFANRRVTSERNCLSFTPPNKVLHPTRPSGAASWHGSVLQ
jgi:hypothetical protein